MKRIIKKVRLNSIRYVDLERDPLQWWIKSVRRIKKAKTFSILRFSCCYGSIAHNKLFSSKFDIWAPRSGFGEIPWTPSAHKLDHCTYLCTGRDPRSCARDTIILARHRYPHHHPINKKQILGAKCLIASLVSVSYTHLRAHETDSYLVC